MIVNYLTCIQRSLYSVSLYYRKFNRVVNPQLKEYLHVGMRENFPMAWGRTFPRNVLQQLQQCWHCLYEHLMKMLSENWSIAMPTLTDKSANLQRPIKQYKFPYSLMRKIWNKKQQNKTIKTLLAVTYTGIWTNDLMTLWFCDLYVIICTCMMFIYV